MRGSCDRLLICELSLGGLASFCKSFYFGIAIVKKLLLAILLGLGCICGWAQEWTNVKLDDNITVKMPKGYLQKGTLLEHQLMGFASYGNVLASKIKMSEEDIQSTTIKGEADLRSMYTAIAAELYKTPDPPISHSIEVVRGLLVLKLNIQFLVGKDLIQMDQWQLYLDHAIFTFYYLHYDSVKTDPAVIKEKQAFFDGIQLKEGLSMSDQTDFSGIGYKLQKFFGHLLPYFLGSIGLLIILIALTVALSRKRMNLKAGNA